MKNRLLTTNSDIAYLVAFGGLSTISCFVIFLPEYAIHLSIAAFVLSLWGMLSLKQMARPDETEQVERIPHVNHKPHNTKNKQRRTTAAVLILLWGVLLFSATIFVDATQIREQQKDPDCLDEGQKPTPGLICPNPRIPCPLQEE